MSAAIVPFESPGLHRRIKVYPAPGVVNAGLEDDFHRFLLRLKHADGVITAVETRAERIPWSTCSAAGAFLAEQAVGQRLETVAKLDGLSHCTHLFDLTILLAAHAGDTQPTRFDLWVADRTDTRTRASLSENDQVMLAWELDETTIVGPAEWRGRDLRKLSKWRSELTPQMAERAMLMRRAIYISGGRSPTVSRPQRAADRGSDRMGACFTYQMPRALDAIASPEWRREFSGTAGPLQNYDPQWR